MKAKITILFLFFLLSNQAIKAQCCCTIAGNPNIIGCNPPFLKDICEGFLGGVYSSSPCGLPVELLSFTAEIEDNTVLLEWQTASEINNERFELERSDDGINWDIIQFIEGNGNSSQLQIYSYIDKNPFVGVNYYRLKQVDFNGAFKYEGGIISVDFKVKEVRMLPTFVSNEFLLQFPSQYNQNTKIEIYNMSYKIVKTKVLTENLYEYKVNATDLPKGIYFLRIHSENNVIVKRFAKQ